MSWLLKQDGKLIFLIAMGVPFFGSWNISGTSIGTFKQIFPFLLFYLLFILSKKKSFVDNPSKYKVTAISIYVISFTLMTTVSGFFAKYIEPAIQQIIINVFVLLVLLLMSELVYTWQRLKMLYKGLAFGFLLALLIGFMQYLGFEKFNLFREEDLNPNTSFATAGDKSEIVRIWGPFGNALTFSFYLSTAGVMIFYYFKVVIKKKLFSYIILLLTILGIIITVSRTALVATLGSILLCEFIIRDKYDRFKSLIILFSIILIAGLSIRFLDKNNPIVDRFLSSNDDFDNGRADLWRTGLKIFEENIFWGSGPGNLNIQLNSHGLYIVNDNMFKLSSNHVENYYLTLLSTYGVFAFTSYLFFIYSCLKTSLKLLPKFTLYSSNAISLPIFSGLISLLINNFSNPALASDYRIQLLFILLVSQIIFIQKVGLNNWETFETSHFDLYLSI